jgi:histidinol phosphatase-like enzyme (inositol monophosphatase family)
MTDFDAYIPFIRELVRRSGEVILPYFARHDVAVERKADETPVTIADRSAEEVMRALIHERYPEHGIIGEEFGNENIGAEFVWVLDPIDGTKAFATACPLFGTLIALRHNGKPVLGAIHLPVLRQLMIGDGAETTLNGTPVRVRAAERIGDATMLISDFLSVEQYRDPVGYDRLTRSVRLLRTWGDCFGYVQLASGWADIVVDPVMEVWDIQALIPIVRGAGGVITSWEGGDPVDARSIVAASPSLHGSVMEYLNGGGP